MSPNANVGKSKIAVSERWIKLYRRIHNLFLAKEFIHVEDYKIMFKQLNKRIDQLNKKVDANFNTVQTVFGAHTHVALQAATGAIPTNPPSTQITTQSTPVPSVPYIDDAMKTEDSTLKALGPASAPLGTGNSLAASKASVTAASQVTMEG